MNFETYTGWLLLLAYASLVVELWIFPVPSEASTMRILNEGDHLDGVDPQNARRRSTARKLLEFLLPTTVVMVLFVLPLLVAWDPRLRPWTFPLSDGTPEFVMTGLGLIFVGRLVTGFAVLQLYRALGHDGPSLQCAGPFRFSRNPILVGLYLFYIGNCVWLPSPMIWGGFVLYAWSMHRRVLMEEGVLRTRFQGNYLDYMASVPRYLGIPRRPSQPR